MITSSATQICNIVLDVLQQPAELSDIENPVTDKEKLFSRHYNDKLEYLLRKYVWNFAKSRALLARDESNTPPFDYSDAYKLPNDFVRLINFNDYDSLYDVDYDMAGGFLLLNANGASTCKLRYIKNEMNVSKFDAGFKRLLVYYIALDLAFKLTGKQTVVDRIAKLIDLDEAKIVSIDGQEKPPKRVQYSKYIGARHGLNLRDNPIGPITYGEV